MSTLKAAAARAQAWITDTALPLWAERGVDPDGAFYELLDFAGRPIKDSNRRMRVQARQLYVFSEAALRGWLPGARGISDRGFDRMMAECWSPDGQPGFLHTLTPDRAPLDTHRDAYDTAFGLFSLAWRYRLDGDARTKGLGLAVAEFLATDMAHPGGEGYLESLPPALPRRSNPHMHLLEAFMAWAEISGDAVFFDGAARMLDLFRKYFYDPATTTYGEFFTDDWRPAPGAAGQSVEPGHHFEWTWLLSEAHRLGIADLRGEADALYDFALRNGLNAAGFAMDEMDRAGEPLKTSGRVWCQNEMLKAHVAQARAGRAGAAQAAAEASDAFLDSYLATAVAGLWNDQLDAEGAVLAANVPASTLYHIQLAFRELIDFAAAA
jgi:mannose-6-phosphate isomerase